MPPLAVRNCRPSIYLHQISRHLDHPVPDIFIHDQIVEGTAQLRPEILQQLCPAAAEFFQRFGFDRERRRMRRQI